MSWTRIRGIDEITLAGQSGGPCWTGPAMIRLAGSCILAAHVWVVLSQVGVAGVDFSAGFGQHSDELGRSYFVMPPADHPRSGMSSIGGGSAAPFPLDETFLLHSLPGASKVIYLDFDGHGDDLGYDFDGNHQSFSDAEREEIQQAWQRAAEDFIPFDVDVTTEFPGTGHTTVEAQIQHGDLNLDGITDLADWYILRQAMIASGNGSLAGELSIPEPSTYLLALIAIGFGILLRGSLRQEPNLAIS